MLRLVSKITIKQIARAEYPTRTKTFILDFVNSCEISSSWENLTDTAELIFPKDLYFTDENSQKVTWVGKNTIGSAATTPLLLRGDKITIELGYIYPTGVANEEKIDTNVEFDGYITEINNDAPIRIKCEDKMWLFKQVRCKNQVFPSATYKLDSIIEALISQATTDTTIYQSIRDELSASNVTVITGTATNNVSTDIGDFRTQNETLAQVLDRLKKDYRIYSYFRGSELRVSGIVYYPLDRVENVFEFQQNIVSDSLDYKRLDDLQIGAKAYSVQADELTSVNSKGGTITKGKRLSTFVGQEGGEIRTIYVYGAANVAELKEKANKELSKFYYEGYRGDFTTFGLPSIKHGDGAILRDKVLTERNGTYLVRGVKKNFGVDGFRQTATLHIKIDDFSETTIGLGL